jgi:hypothetical protein
VSVERTVYAGLLAAAAFWAVMSAVLLLGTTHEAGRGTAWVWGACFVAASLAAARCFWELLEGGA